MSIATVITGGYGTFGTVSLVITDGYSGGAPVAGGDVYSGGYPYGGYPGFKKRRRSIEEVEAEREAIVRRQRIEWGILPPAAVQAVDSAAVASHEISRKIAAEGGVEHDIARELAVMARAEREYAELLRTVYEGLMAEQMRQLWRLEVERRRLEIEDEELLLLFAA